MPAMLDDVQSRPTIDIKMLVWPPAAILRAPSMGET